MRYVIPSLLTLAALLCLAMGGALTLGIYHAPNQWADGIFYCGAIACAALAYTVASVDTVDD